jgi:Uma2 family endonuclease
MGKAASRVTKPTAIPPLRDGDRMGVDEFLRRYAADKVVYSAELLKGVVHVTHRREILDGKELFVPPLGAAGHSEPQGAIIWWFGTYAVATPGTKFHPPTTTILPSKTTGLEPDALLRLLPEHGGGSAIGADKFVHGLPELIAEVSYSSGSRDLGMKYEAFEADGVPEYLVWRTDVGAIEWFVLKRKKYMPLKPHPDGTLRSETFPGLWLDPAALLAGDLAKVLAVVQQGIASPEHAAFVAKLQKGAGRRKKK